MIDSVDRRPLMHSLCILQVGVCKSCTVNVGHLDLTLLQLVLGVRYAACTGGRLERASLARCLCLSEAGGGGTLCNLTPPPPSKQERPTTSHRT